MYISLQINFPYHQSEPESTKAFIIRNCSHHQHYKLSIKSRSSRFHRSRIGIRIAAVATQISKPNLLNCCYIFSFQYTNKRGTGTLVYA